MRSYRWCGAAALVGLLGWGSGAGAQDKRGPVPLMTPLALEIDLKSPQVRKWLVAVALNASREGTALFAQKRFQDCYYYYHATLSSILPALEPALAARVQGALVAAAVEPYFDRAAVYLRAALNDIRNRNDVYDAAGKDVGERPLFDRLGGREAVQAIVKMTYDRAAADGSGVNLTRNGEYPYTTERATRMQKATVDLIRHLSDKRQADKGLPVAAKAPAAAAASDFIRAQLADLNTQYATAVEDLGKALKNKELEKADVLFRQVGDLGKRRDEFAKAVAADTTRPVLGAKAGGSDVSGYLRRGHRGMRITDEEYSAAERLFRESLVLHAVPSQEVEELLRVVGELRELIVVDLP